MRKLILSVVLFIVDPCTTETEQNRTEITIH